MVEREQEALEDPLLQFLYELSIQMDFEAASEHLALCEDVLASDFFLGASWRRSSCSARVCWCWS